MVGGPRCWLSHMSVKVSNLVHGWRRIRTVERVHCFSEEKNDYSKRFHSYDGGVRNTAAT